MGKENYKPGAKCRYSRRCAIFGSNILRQEYEKQMCQSGKEVDKTYVPLIPHDTEPKPEEFYDISPDGTCPAFNGFVYNDFYYDLEDLIGDVKRVFHGELPLFDLTDAKKPSQ